MTRVYIADAELEHRRALRLLLLELTMEVAGGAATLAKGGHSGPGEPM